MGKKAECIYKIAVLIMWAMSCGFMQNETLWQKMSSGINENVINCIAVHPADNNLIFAGTPNALYRSVNAGQDFQNVLTVPGSLKGVNYIYINPESEEEIFAATDSGVFVSYSRGDYWEKIYDSRDPQTRRCLTVIADQDFVYTGTPGGLFSKVINSPVWHRQEGVLGNTAVYGLRMDQDYIYIAAESEVFRFDKGRQGVKKIFTLGGKEENGAEAVNGDDAVSVYSRKIRDLVVFKNRIFLAADKGVFYSADQGENWRRFSSQGLPLEDITSISILEPLTSSHGQGAYVWAQEELPSQGPLIFAGTTKGIYRYEGTGWLPLYKGLETNDIRFLTHDSQGKIYAATSRGVFFSAPGQAAASAQGDMTVPDYKEITEQFKDEPSILEVQGLAIDYADVNPGKIRGWQAASRIKAILPDLSVGIDRADTDLFHWNTGASPDELQKGRDYLDWDVAVSWDLGDLIWSTNQTTIDSRSKYTVELREDILDQITRLYFERRRIQVELMAASFAQPQVRIDKQMRVEELTALIDALTGGGFSQRIAESKRGKEETAR